MGNFKWKHQGGTNFLSGAGAQSLPAWSPQLFLDAAASLQPDGVRFVSEKQSPLQRRRCFSLAASGHLGEQRRDWKGQRERGPGQWKKAGHCGAHLKVHLLRHC